jgi:outer membrane protein TolC
MAWLLFWMQFFLAIVIAHARNDPPPASDRTWAPPGLSTYEAELAERRFNKMKGGAEISIDPRKVYGLADLIDIAQRNNPATRVAWERGTAGSGSSWFSHELDTMALFLFSKVWSITMSPAGRS